LRSGVEVESSITTVGTISVFFSGLLRAARLLQDLAVIGSKPGIFDGERARRSVGWHVEVVLQIARQSALYKFHTFQVLSLPFSILLLVSEDSFCCLQHGGSFARVESIRYYT
jgi:hypothetical protein